VGAFIVFDINDIRSFEAVRRWKNDMDAKISLGAVRPIKVILLANKVRVCL
jgi:Ras-related protein Rab-32